MNWSRTYEKAFIAKSIALSPMADESRLSSVIDDDGNLFGVINVVDALVVLLVLAVAAAGAALLVPSGDSETRYVTIELGPQPDFTVEQIGVGDEADIVTNADTDEETTAEDALQITDLYLFPAEGDGDQEGDVSVIVRAEIEGDQIAAGDSTTIGVGGEALRFGESLQIETTDYVASGTVTAIEEDDADITTEEETFVVQADVDRRVAGNVEVGDTYQIGDSPLVTVESVSEYVTDDRDTRRVVLGVSAETRVAGETAFVGEQPLRTGADLSIRTDTYDVTGEIIRTGSTQEPGTPDTRELSVTVDELSPTRTNALQAGMTEDVRDSVTAELLAVTDRPAEQVLESGGELVVREHPRDREVDLTIETSVREQQDGSIQFRGDSLAIGEDVTFQFGDVIVDGELRDIDQ